MHRTSRIALVILLLLASALSGQLAFSQQTPQMLVTTDWLDSHLQDANLIILDIRKDSGTFSAGHIPGARLLLLRDIAVTAPGGWMALPAVADLKVRFEQAGVGDRSRIVLYGDYKGLFATRAYFTLDYLGLGSRASILDGGLEKWQAEHRAISNAASVMRPSTLTVHLRPEAVVDLSTVVRIVSSKSTPLVDARAPTEFAGKNGGAGAARTGHIPGAKDVFWGNNLSATDIPALKPLAAIRASYLAAGLKPGSKVIVYCQGGLQASHDYFTLKLAGFQPALYAGSFAEWAAAFGTPVEVSGN